VRFFGDKARKAVEFLRDMVENTEILYGYALNKNGILWG